MSIIGFFLKEPLFPKMFLKKLWIKQYQKAYYNSNVLTLDKYQQLIPEFYSYITIIAFGTDNYDVGQELREVKPTNIVVTKYI